MNKNHYHIGMLILRVGFGIGFIYFHGWGKITGGVERWKNLGGAMDHIGIHFGHTFFGFMAALSETLGALLFASGLFFSPSCYFLAFTMAMASLSHFVSGEGSPGNALKNFFLFTGLSFMDPGKYSLDYWFFRKNK